MLLWLIYCSLPQILAIYLLAYILSSTATTKVRERKHKYKNKILLTSSLKI